jgi:ATP synthase protein I
LRQKKACIVKNLQGGQLARRLLLIQLSVTIVGAIAFSKGVDVVSFWSGMLGGLVCCVPNALFASIFFREQRVSQAKQIAAGFYRAEMCKLLASVLLFTLVFSLLRVRPAVFFAMYFLVQLTLWLSPWIMLKKQTK